MLTQAVATDPAMLIWLDANSNKASDPNENFARELMERFTMGIGTYTQADVRAAVLLLHRLAARSAHRRLRHRRPTSTATRRRPFSASRGSTPASR